MADISSISSVRSLVHIAKAKQITDVILSPGSRNAPFILSFSALDSFHCTSVLDERSAGFIALGIAQQKRKPVLLSCTSGSAMINYTPAMVEAFHQNIPLIVITADRPAEWIDQGEGQSIRQTQLMDGVFVKNFNLVWAQDKDQEWLNERLINEAFITVEQEQKPVQINVPLREPLYNTEAFDEKDALKLINKKAIERSLPYESRDFFEKKWEEAKSIIILVGQSNSVSGLEDQLRNLMNDQRIVVLTETTANLYHLGFVCCIDRTIDSFMGSENQADFAPELLITIGGNLISKKLKAFLRSHKSMINDHWHLGEELLDTFQSLTEIVDVNPAEFFRQIATEGNPSEYGTKWKKQFFLTEQKHIEFLANAPYSDLKVFELLMEFVPDHAQLQMGNSSVVRYIQLFNHLRNVSYFGNRGVSGIEGCVSTAVGAAMATENMVIHISGDQAFRYDSNALAQEDLPQNLRIVVINNGGGNIFRIIDGPKQHENSEAFIEKVDTRSIQKLVEYHNVNYAKADNLEELGTALIQMISPDQTTPMVLEVFTPRIESPELLKEYFGFLNG